MDYWQGLLDYEKKQQEKKNMKETLKDFGSIILDCFIAIVLAIIVLNILGSILVVKAYGQGYVEVPLQKELTQEQKIVAMTILGEARGEGEKGMYAVACVIKQRALAWKKSPKDVCLQNATNKRGVKVWQFSCWNEGDPNREVIQRLIKHDTKSVRYAKRLAVHLLTLNTTYTANADHYCTLKTKPYWAKGKAPVRIIGNHKFYKLR